MGTKPVGGTCAAVTATGRRGIREHVCQRGGGEHRLDAGGGFVEPAVQRAELVAVLGQPERAHADPPRRLDRRHDVEQRDVRRVGGEEEPAAEPALRADQPGVAAHLEHLREVPGRDVRAPGDLLSGECGRRGRRPARCRPLRRQAQHGPERVLSGLRDHVCLACPDGREKKVDLDLDIQNTGAIFRPSCQSGADLRRKLPAGIDRDCRVAACEVTAGGIATTEPTMPRG